MSENRPASQDEKWYDWLRTDKEEVGVIFLLTTVILFIGILSGEELLVLALNIPITVVLETLRDRSRQRPPVSVFSLEFWLDTVRHTLLCLIVMGLEMALYLAYLSPAYKYLLNFIKATIIFFAAVIIPGLDSNLDSTSPRTPPSPTATATFTPSPTFTLTVTATVTYTPTEPPTFTPMPPSPVSLKAELGIERVLGIQCADNMNDYVDYINVTNSTRRLVDFVAGYAGIDVTILARDARSDRMTFYLLASDQPNQIFWLDPAVSVSDRACAFWVDEAAIASAISTGVVIPPLTCEVCSSGNH